MVNKNWFDKWTNYLGILGGKGDGPRPSYIDNSVLLTGDNEAVQDHID